MFSFFPIWSIRYDCYCPALLYFVWYLKQTQDKVIWKYLIAIHFITFYELFYSISVMLTYSDMNTINCFILLVSCWHTLTFIVAFFCIADEIRIWNKMVYKQRIWYSVCCNLWKQWIVLFYWCHDDIDSFSSLYCWRYICHDSTEF